MKISRFFPATLSIMAIACLSARAEQNVPSSADATSASAAVDSPSAVSPETGAVDHVVYLARLPTPAALLNGAKAQGITISRMDQTGDRLVVVYEHTGGRTVTFAYTLLSSVDSGSAPTVATAAAKPASTASYTQEVSATRVVYDEPARIYYPSRSVRYYDPAWDFWAPMTLGVGIGLIGGHGHGWYGGHGWRGGQGWNGVRHGRR